MSFRQTELLSSTDKKRVKNTSEINLNIYKDPCERFRDAFDVGKDCKVASEVGSTHLKNIPTNSSAAIFVG